MLKNLSALIIILFLSSCAYYAQQTTQEDITKAIAVLQPTQGNKVSGTVTFTKADDGGVQVTADLQGLEPGKHGFHIHQYGDLSSADGKSAGDHFNPMKMRHAGPDDAEHHAGDLGNITAGADGTAHLDMKISTNLNSIIGRAVVVHEKEDDLMSQPAGNAGARIAVGVIGIANSSK